jgi:hypothetical protein
MFNTTDAAPRADISSLLMEAVGQEGLYIGQAVMPIFPSAVQVGRYPKFRIQKGRLLQAANSGATGGLQTKRNKTGTYNETEREFEWDSFQTEEYGLEERVDDAVARAMEDYFDAEMVTGKLLMNELMMDYEVEVAAIVNNATTFTATHASGTAPGNLYTEANTSGTTPFDVPRDMSDVIERLSLVGEVPEDAVMSLSVWNRIRRSQKLQTYIYGFLNVTQGGSQITEQMFAQTFGLKRLFIARKSVDKGVRGKAASLSPIWGNGYIAVGRFAEGDFMNGGVGRTIVWDSDSPGGLFTSESYRDEKRRGEMLRVRSNRVLKVVNPNALQLIDTGFDGAFLT